MTELIDLIAIEVMKILIKDKIKRDGNINDYTTYISSTSYNIASEMIKQKTIK